MPIDDLGERIAVLETRMEDLPTIKTMVTDLHDDFMVRKSRWSFANSAGRYFMWSVAGLATFFGANHAADWFMRSPLK